MRTLVQPLGLAVILLLALVACGDTHERHEFTDIRELDQPRHDSTPGMSPMERLGLQGLSAPGHARRPTLTWKTPTGWEEVRGSSMRSASWRVKGQAQTDVGLSLMPRGAVGDNVNRWRKEMGLVPMKADEIAGLPRRKVLDFEGVYVDVRGDFGGGAGGGARVNDARLLGLIVQGANASVFLKFTGPAAVVAAEQENFEALADSLDSPDRKPAAPPPASSGPLQWTAPEGWEAQPKRTMRVATFHPKDVPGAWCYVSIVGGSVLDNSNRWRAEMGKDPLSQEAFEKITKLEMLGTQAVMLDLEGKFRGTGGPTQENARMLGVICPRGSRAVFIKMVGPKDKMDSQKDKFIAFCKSLR